ncbi:MAG: RNA methyltransferase [Corynebacteriales bacterium]|nr:RNA methyltransferase [Mycobacteriales bacterium]
MSAKSAAGGSADQSSFDSSNARVIQHADDPRIVDFRSLTDVHLRSLREPEHGLFIAEGELVLERALRAGHVVRSILVDERRIPTAEKLLAEHGQSAPIYYADLSVLEDITGFHVHRGVLASVHRPRPLTAAQVMSASRRVVIIEDVNNHTNLGSVFRSAAALGMDGILLSPTCVDPLYRRCVRVSMGQVFAVPYARLDPWPDALGQVRDAGFSLMALTPDDSAISLRELPDRARVRPALVVGAEGPGLTMSALSSADYRVRVPMHHAVDSLNVAVTVAIACYELGPT